MNAQEVGFTGALESWLVQEPGREGWPVMRAHQEVGPDPLPSFSTCSKEPHGIHHPGGMREGVELSRLFHSLKPEIAQAELFYIMEVLYNGDSSKVSFLHWSLWKLKNI